MESLRLMSFLEVLSKKNKFNYLSSAILGNQIRRNTCHTTLIHFTLLQH